MNVDIAAEKIGVVLSLTIRYIFVEEYLGTKLPLRMAFKTNTDTTSWRPELSVEGEAIDEIC